MPENAKFESASDFVRFGKTRGNSLNSAKTTKARYITYKGAISGKLSQNLAQGSSGARRAKAAIALAEQT